MPDDNKEKVFPDETQPENTDALSEQSSDDDKRGDNWQWDAAIPETVVEDITQEVEIVIPVSQDDANEETEETEEKAEDTVEAAANNAEEKDEDDSKEEDDGLCIVCGKKRGKSPSDLYCETCRAKFLRTDYGVGHIILAFVMVLVAAVGYFVCVSTCELSDLIVKAQTCISEKRFDDAVDTCSKVTTTVDTLNSGVNAVFTGINSNFGSKTWFTEGSRATWLVLDAYTQTISTNADDISTYTQAVEQYFTEKQLNSPKNSKIKACYDFCNEMTSFADTFAEKWESYIKGDESETYVIPYDETIKYLDSVKTNNDSEKCIVSYYKFMTAYYAKKDNSVILDLFGQTYKLAGDYGYMFNQSYMALTWELKEYNKLLEITDVSIERNINDTTAYYYAVKTYIIKSDFDSAEKLCSDMKANNPDGLDYYSIQAEIDRRQGDFQDAVDVCKEGLKKGSDAEIYRQQAIAYMLLNDKTNALEAIKQGYSITLQAAYSNSSSSTMVPVFNTAALIACICEDTDTYDEIKSIFDQQGATFEESVQSCIKGDITFEDIFMKGTGDI